MRDLSLSSFSFAVSRILGAAIFAMGIVRSISGSIDIITMVQHRYDATAVSMLMNSIDRGNMVIYSLMILLGWGLMIGCHKNICE